MPLIFKQHSANLNICPYHHLSSITLLLIAIHGWATPPAKSGPAQHYRNNLIFWIIMIRAAHYTKNEANQQLEPQFDDLEAVWQIFKQVIATGDTYIFNPDTPLHVFEDYWFGPQMQTYVYEEDGKILATYRIRPNQVDLGSHIANAGFLVLPESQGKGIGHKLVQHCLDRAKDLGFKAIQFNIVAITNQAAVALYKKFGFSIIGTVPEAFNNLKLNKLVDAHIMYRKL